MLKVQPKRLSSTPMNSYNRRSMRGWMSGFLFFVVHTAWIQILACEFVMINAFSGFHLSYEILGLSSK